MPARSASPWSLRRSRKPNSRGVMARRRFSVHCSRPCTALEALLPMSSRVAAIARQRSAKASGSAGAAGRLAEESLGGHRELLRAQALGEDAELLLHELSDVSILRGAHQAL